MSASLPPSADAPGTNDVPGPNVQPSPDRVLLHMPVDVRSAALVVIAVLLSVFALHWAKAVFVPLLMALMFSYALTPVVDAMCRWHIPRALAAAVLLLTLTAAIASSVYSLRDDADSLIESLPEAAHTLRKTIRDWRTPHSSSLEQIQKAAAQLEMAAAGVQGPAAPRGVSRVQIERPTFHVRDYVVVGTLGMAQLVGQFTVVGFITYFLLASGDVFRRKLARIAGPTFSKRKITVQALDEITQQVRRYLVVQLVTSVLVGVATGVAFWLVGLQHFTVWGIAAGVLNLIPYIGSVVISAASAVVALTQFGSIEKALGVAGISVALHIVSGYMVTPWLTSRTSRLNMVVVFVGMLAWGWLWGIWGLLLGTPILMAVKAICDRVDDLKPVGSLLGGPDEDSPAPPG